MQAFDEDDALAFIRQHIGQEMSEKYTDDELLYVVDIIWDYYEKQGLLSLTDLEGEDELLDTDALQQFVKKELRRIEEITITDEDVAPIVNAELSYEESLEDVL